MTGTLLFVIVVQQALGAIKNGVQEIGATLVIHIAPPQDRFDNNSERIGQPGFLARS